MNTTEAERKTGVNRKTIQKICKDGYVYGAVKPGREWIIPDDTNIILTKEQIAYVLMQIIKRKNNPSAAVSNRLFPDHETRVCILQLLYKLGLVGNEPDEAIITDEILNNITLTDDGLELLFTKKRSLTLPISINILSVNAGINPSLIG